MTRLPYRFLLPALAGFFLAACSLAGSNPPPAEDFGAPVNSAFVASDQSTPAPEASGAQPTAAAAAPVALAPQGRPSAADGAALYTQHCAPCHGETGNADGPMAANVPSGADSVPKFALPDRARQASPQAWFQVVTQGRLDKFMPPFQDKLSDADRWNVVAFIYTLSTPKAALDAGGQVYIANCARCHGEDGRGKGPEAASMQMRDFTDPQLAAAFSPAQLFDAITTGSVPGHDFQTKLSEEDRWNAVAFVRAFAYDYYEPGAPLPVKTGIVRGQVTNATAGSAPDGPLTVNLLGFDQQGVTQTFTGTTDAQGNFQFDAVPYQAGEQFVVAATFQDIAYHSTVVEFAAGQSDLTVPINVYEKTDQAADVRISRVHTFILFEVPGFVTIGQLYILSNLGDRTFEPASGRTVEFALPADATELQVQDGTEGTTYFRTDTGFVDTVPVLPGESSSQMLFSFKLPYQDSLKFEQKMLYPVDNVNVMIGDQSVALTGDQFVAGASQDVSGQTFTNYTRAGLDAGGTLAFELKGASGVTAASTQPAAVTNSSPTDLAVGLGVLAVALLGIGGWWWQRSNRAAPGAARPAASAKSASEREDLLQAIAELDDEHAAGRVSDAEYQKERAWLKQELQKVWNAGDRR